MNVLLLGNPARRRKMLRRYNPTAAAAYSRKYRSGGKKVARGKAISRQYLQGIGMTEALAAAGGLVIATVLPGMIVKTTDTTSAKWMKVGVAALAAVGAGMVGKAISPSAAKFAVVGGLAGVAVQALNVLSPGLIAGTGVRRGSIPMGFGGRGVGVPMNVPSQGYDSQIITNVT